MKSVCVSLLILATFSAVLFAQEPAAKVPLKAHDGPALDGAKLSDDQSVVHVLTRLAFGPRPGQVQQLRQLDWEKWVRQQLRPATIDDSEVEKRIAAKWPALYMSLDELQENYMMDGPREQLPRAVLYRAVYCERQFQEVIVNFWRNHFSVDKNKEQIGHFSGHYDQTLRKHAFGRFERLLLATAQHPAMLMYLDNDVSQKPLTDSQQRLVNRYESRDRKPRSVRALARHRGLNENYARELMELHTLGVDNSYSQRDVTELARVLTGWTVGKGDGSPMGGPGGEYGFYFYRDVHDRGAKVVLGQRLTGLGGVDDGIRIVRKLAAHPGTGRFIAYKLCRYLVSDDPSPQLVKRVAGVFKRTRGDLSKVYESIVLSDEFLKRGNYRVKFKTPFEFVVSALRATGAELDDCSGVLESLHLMGYDIYGCMDPTGYYDQAEAWLDPGVLVYRWDFALRLGEGMVDGVRIPDAFMAKLDDLEPEQLQTVLYDEILPGGLDPTTQQLLGREVAGAFSERRALGLALGSPVFQQQ